MINQRLYPDVVLGNGSPGQTVALYGCYLCALLQGLIDRGHKYTVRSFNKLLIDRDVFSGTLLSSTAIAMGIPEIFIEGRNEAWSDEKLIQYFSDARYIVLGEVSGKGIGGNGQHFVYIKDIDVSGGKIKMSYVDDPWDGLEYMKVTTRYNAFGNILSLRVFKIKLPEESSMAANMYGKPNSYDLNNPESMKVAVDVLNKVQEGLYVSKAEADEKLSKQIEEANTRYSGAIKEGIDSGVENSVVKIIDELELSTEIDSLDELIVVLKTLIGQSNPVNPPTSTPIDDLPATIDMKDWEQNGLFVEHTVGNKKYIINYMRKK